MGSILMRSTSLILIALMLCQYGGDRTYAVTRTLQNRSDRASIPKKILENRFDSLLAELKETVEHGGAKTKSAPEQGFADIRRLSELKDSLVEENEKIQEYFGRFESSLKQKNLPGEILNRHVSFVREYDAKYQALMESLKGIESSHKDATGLWAKLTGKNKKVDWDAAIGKTLNFLEKNTARPRESHFDPANLPHRSLRADKPTPPKLTREEWLKAFPKESALQSSPGTADGLVLATAPPASADLAETIEVKFTPEIIKLADSLGKNPVKIFNWVRNNIGFVPTWGSIQGAQLCLETRTGNAFDTASLLIALLRYSGISARYQMGTIEVPVEKFKNWAGGFTDADAAASLFASGGVPSVVRRVNQSGQVVTVKLEHVWVKALVDYSPSGGQVQRQGDSWVEIDPSFKQHSFLQNVDLNSAVPSNFRAFIDQLASTATIDSTTGSVTKIDREALASFLTNQADRRLRYIRDNFPPTTREIFGGQEISPQSLAILAAASPYHVLARANELSQIPDSLRHRVTIALGSNPQMPDSDDLWSYTTSLPEMASKSILLLYSPASQADEQLLDSILDASAGKLPLTIPSYVNLASQLHVGDQIKVTGRPLRAGSAVISRIKFLSPTVSLPVISNTMIAGENAALGFDLQGIPPAQMKAIKEGMRQLDDKIQKASFEAITRYDIANLLLSSSVAAWFSVMDNANTFASTAAGVVTIRYPSVGMFYAKQEVRSVFGVALSISSEAMNMDIDGDVVISVAKNSNAATTVRLSRALGAFGSALEARIPDAILSTSTDLVRSLSTMDALVMANDQEIPIFLINAANASTIIPKLQVASADLADIQDAINAGLQVTVPEKPVSFDGQPILGMVIEDPRTGSAGFLISGGTNGALKKAFNLAVWSFASIHSNDYEWIGKEDWQWVPQFTNDVLDLGIKAFEYWDDLHGTMWPEDEPDGCWKNAFIVTYVSTKLVEGLGPNEDLNCVICSYAYEFGYTRFAQEVMGCQ